MNKAINYFAMGWLSGVIFFSLMVGQYANATIQTALLLIAIALQ